MSALLLFALPIGRRPLVNQDEARFALLAREGVEHGEWMLPRVRGVIYLNKPPLYFWTVGLLALPFGVVDETSAPLASLLSALATLVAVVAIGRRLWGPEVGLAGALVLATAPYFYFMSHQVLSDVMMTAWLAWALYFLVTARAAAAPTRRLVGFYLCVAGAVASKGPAALMALAGALAVVVLEDGWKGARWLRLPMGLGILALSALPWLLPYVLQTERSYFGSVVVRHYGDWYLRPKRGSRLVELGDNLGRFLPWTIMVPAAVWWWWRDRDGRRRPLIVWTVMVAVAVSLSGEQRARYFVPVLPPLALLVGELLVRGAADRRLRRVLAGLLAVMLLAVAALVVALLWLPAGAAFRAPATFMPAEGWERGVACALALGGVAAALVLMWYGAGFAATAALAAALGGILLTESWGYPRRYAESTNIRGFTAALAANLQPDSRVLAYPDAGLAYDFYLRRPVRELGTEAELAAELRAPGPTDVLMIRERQWTVLRLPGQERWRVVLVDRVGPDRMLLLEPQR
ncbi:MAG TPA: glycosyltransferase family 39 protein [Methylomirabilota bacterium]|nr:glycosyltransferase family 39 protein [Methylomirabilota bacterium]